MSVTLPARHSGRSLVRVRTAFGTVSVGWWVGLLSAGCVCVCLCAQRCRRLVSAPVRVNMVVALADLASRWPNVLEPWTAYMYEPLSGELATKLLWRFTRHCTTWAVCNVGSSAVHGTSVLLNGFERNTPCVCFCWRLVWLAMHRHSCCFVSSACLFFLSSAADPEPSVKLAALSSLTHLVLGGMVKAKGNVAKVAMLLVDDNQGEQGSVWLGVQAQCAPEAAAACRADTVLREF